MNKIPQDDFQCSQFEAALAEALDHAGQGAAGEAGLAPELHRAFEAHRLSCPACGPLYAEALEGMLLLRSLEEVEPPRHLVHNILAATSRAEGKSDSAALAEIRTSWFKRFYDFRDLRPRLGGLLHSRFAASFCMAFFSLSLTLSLIGVRFGDLAKVDLRPNALRKSVVLQYTQIEARVMRYYDNMRLVYEVQSQVQKLKQAATPAPNQDNQQPQQQNQKHAPGKGRPEREENYSQERDGSLVAKMMKSEGALL